MSEKLKDIAGYVCSDNHTYVPKKAFGIFEEMYVSLTTVLDEKGEPHFIIDVSNDIIEIVKDYFYDALWLADEEEDRFVRISFNDLIQHIEECVKDEVKSKMSMKTEKDISKYPDFDDCDILYHKGRYYSKVGRIDQYNYTLDYILQLATDEYDRDKKAKKAVKKRTIATFEAKTREIYCLSGKNYTRKNWKDEKTKISEEAKPIIEKLKEEGKFKTETTAEVPDEKKEE